MFLLGARRACTVRENASKQVQRCARHTHHESGVVAKSSMLQIDHDQALFIIQGNRRTLGMKILVQFHNDLLSVTEQKNCNNNFCSYA